MPEGNQIIGARGIAVLEGGALRVQFVDGQTPHIASDATDTGHHSRFVPRSSFSPPRHAALAPMTIAAASRFIGLSPCPRAGDRQSNHPSPDIAPAAILKTRALPAPPRPLGRPLGFTCS